MSGDPAAASALRAEIGRLAMLAEITNAVASTLDAEEALRRLARLVVPRLGDWCVVDLYTPPDRVERVAVAHRDPGRAPAGKYEQVLPPLDEAATAPLARVLRGVPALLLATVPHPRTAASPLDHAQLSLLAELDADTAIVAPLRGRAGQILGAVTVVRTDPHAALASHDVELVEDVARRAALAVENGRLYAAQRDVAETLQRAMLPTLPSSIGHLGCAARYCPARRSAEVGGDWYDVFLLPKGDTALIIGDVAGHDVEAAVRMGQVRNMLRALAYDRQEPPGEVLRRLDQLATDLRVADTATAIYAIVEGRGGGPWQLRWSNAGHPPPLLIHPDGHTEFFDTEPDLLLGIAPARPRVTHLRPLPPRSTLLLYTDGLVEDRDQIGRAHV